MNPLLKKMTLPKMMAFSRTVWCCVIWGQCFPRHWHNLLSPGLSQRSIFKSNVSPATAKKLLEKEYTRNNIFIKCLCSLGIWSSFRVWLSLSFNTLLSAFGTNESAEWSRPKRIVRLGLWVPCQAAPRTGLGRSELLLSPVTPFPEVVGIRTAHTSLVLCVRLQITEEVVPTHVDRNIVCLHQEDKGKTKAMGDLCCKAKIRREEALIWSKTGLLQGEGFFPLRFSFQCCLV